MRGRTRRHRFRRRTALPSRLRPPRARPPTGRRRRRQNARTGTHAATGGEAEDLHALLETTVFALARQILWTRQTQLCLFNFASSCWGQPNSKRTRPCC
jgi:hypothetical protein